MSDTVQVKVPDIGDFDEVPVIEIHVKPGDTVAPEDPLVTLESDKATMDVPAPAGGVVKSVDVAVGDTVSQGKVILTLSAAAASTDAAESAESSESSPPTTSQANGTPTRTNGGSATASKTTSAPLDSEHHAEVVVLGSGPGGYTAAFRAADLGMRTILIEKNSTLGGVCLNVGCIPSKALLHAAKVITDAEEMAEHGLSFASPSIDLDRLRAWKDGVVGRLTGGLGSLAKQRKVQVMEGFATFAGDHVLQVQTATGMTRVSFDHAIIAAGSEVVKLPFIPDDPRIVDSTGALELKDIPERLLVIGGGIIGMEMACVYDALGSKVTVIELMETLLGGADADLVRPLKRRVEKRYEKVLMGSKVTAVEPRDDGLHVTYEGPKGATSERFDRVLVSVGRKPNGHLVAAETAGVHVDERGFIPVDRQMRTNVPHIFAIGDVVGQPMLAHKATHEGRVAAEVAAGQKRAFDARVIPSVAYTDPEVAWVGLTENEAKETGQAYEKSTIPWAASGRALAVNRPEGLTKVLFDPSSGKVLGCGITGPSAGDLIAEVALAIEMDADAADIGLTIHPHPTLSETVAFSAEAFEGTITDLYMPKRKKS
ncbi:MAG: dihydrolipoyl dehydrogenase [Myxococcota bacterium]